MFKELCLTLVSDKDNQKILMIFQKLCSNNILRPLKFALLSCRSKGGFPVMEQSIEYPLRIFVDNFFFVINTAASTRCLVRNFQLICYSQRVNATSQYNDSGSSRCSKWPNDWMVAVVKHCWLFVQGQRGCIER